MAKEERKYYGYQYDSTAKAYTERIEPVRVPTPTTISQPKPAALPRRKVDIAFGLQVTFCGLAIFVCSLLYVHHYAALRITQMELKDLKDEKIMVMNNITEMQAKIDEKLDLSVVEERAEKELGMTKPGAHQIVYIELPKKSYTSYGQKVGK